MEIEAGEQTIMVPLGKVRNRLTTVWLIFAACIFTIVLAQSVLHKYGGALTSDGAVPLTAPTDSTKTDDQMQVDHTVNVWKWLLPNLLPTLTMMVSALAASAFIQNERSTVRRDFYHSAMGLSVFYLVTVAGLLLSQPIANPNSATDQLNSLRTSNIATGPLQGLVAAALGVLFATGKSGDKETPGAPNDGNLTEQNLAPSGDHPDQEIVGDETRGG